MGIECLLIDYSLPIVKSYIEVSKNVSLKGAGRLGNPLRRESRSFSKIEESVQIHAI